MGPSIYPHPPAPPPSRLLPLLSDWIQTLSRVHFDDDNGDHGDGSGSRGGEGASGRLEGRATTTAAVPATPGPSTSASVSAVETRACANILSRCLAMRNSANTAVSKFLELRIDEGAEEGVGGRGGRGRGAGSTAAASVAPAAKKPRLEIRMDGVRRRDRGVQGGVK